MSKTKLLTFLVITLMILNIGTITALILGRPHHQPREKERPQQIIIDRLHLDEAQITQYKKLIETHKPQTLQNRNEMHDAKKALFQLLRQEDQSQKDTLINLIGKLQVELEQMNFQHFKEIKSICRPEQLTDYDALSKDIGKLFSPKRKR